MIQPINNFILYSYRLLILIFIGFNTISCGKPTEKLEHVISNNILLIMPLKIKKEKHKMIHYKLYQDKINNKFLFLSPSGMYASEYDAYRINLQNGTIILENIIKRNIFGEFINSISVIPLQQMIPSKWPWPIGTTGTIHSFRDSEARFDIEWMGEIYNRKGIENYSSGFIKPIIVNRIYFDGIIVCKHRNGQTIFSQKVKGIGAGRMTLYEDITHKFLIYLNFDTNNDSNDINQYGKLLIFKS